MQDRQAAPKVQFVSRKDVWAIGVNRTHAAGPFIVVLSTDAGRTWREVPQTHQYPGEPDGPPAFSFVDPLRGWISWWNGTDCRRCRCGRKEVLRLSNLIGGRDWEESRTTLPGHLAAVRDLFIGDNAQRELMFTVDVGTHWQKQALRLQDFPSDCQVLEGELLCSAENAAGTAQIGICLFGRVLWDRRLD